MSTWLAIPSKKSPADLAVAIAPWRARGYRIAIFRDSGDSPIDADLVYSGEYRGCARATNTLLHAVFEYDPAAQWCVIGGDDQLPAEPPAATIAAECSDHFRGTFGIMHPTGDRFEVGLPDGRRVVSAEYNTIAAFVGREAARRLNGGIGLYHPGYFHFFGDSEACTVAKLLNIWWPRIDLVSIHKHWSREGRERPAYMVKARSLWQSDFGLFARREAAGFPGHEPIA